MFISLTTANSSAASVKAIPLRKPSRSTSTKPILPDVAETIPPQKNEIYILWIIGTLNFSRGVLLTSFLFLPLILLLLFLLLPQRQQHHSVTCIYLHNKTASVRHLQEFIYLECHTKEFQNWLNLSHSTGISNKQKVMYCCELEQSFGPPLLWAFAGW